MTVKQQLILFQLFLLFSNRSFNMYFTSKCIIITTNLSSCVLTQSIYFPVINRDDNCYGTCEAFILTTRYSLVTNRLSSILPCWQYTLAITYKTISAVEVNRKKRKKKKEEEWFSSEETVVGENLRQPVPTQNLV